MCGIVAAASNRNVAEAAARYNAVKKLKGKK